MRNTHLSKVRALMAVALFAIVAIAGAPRAHAEDIQWSWKNGIKGKGAEGSKFKIRGRLMVDGQWAVANDDLEADIGDSWKDGVELRRARMGIEAAPLNKVKAKFEVDFSGGEIEVKDAYIQFKKIFGSPVALTVGNQKEPYSLEELTSSRFILFNERSLANMFAPGRNIGVKVDGDFMDGKAYFGFGIFRPSGGMTEYDADDSNYQFAFRGTFAPILEDEGKSVAHIGLNYRVANLGSRDPDVRFRSRPEIHLGDRLIDTSTFQAKALHQFGGDVAVQFNGIGLSGEYHVVLPTDTSLADDPTLQALYIQAWFIMGGFRSFEGGSFDRIKVENGLYDGGMGAFGVAARWSFASFSDELGDQDQNDITIGLNWYLDDNLYWKNNVVIALPGDQVAAGDGTLFALATRLQFDW